MPTPIRRLSVAAAVAVVLAAMLGTGLYAAFAPAAAAAGPWLPLAVVLAGVVALANASSVSELAAARPGGELRPADLPAPAFRLAAIARLVARGAAAAAAAGVFGAYVLPSNPLPVAVVAVLVVVGLNAAGVRISVGASRGLVAGAAVVLVLVTLVGLFPSATTRASSAIESAAAAGTAAEPAVATLQSAPVSAGPWGVITAAAFMMIAFTGVSRAAELGGSLRDPLRAVRRASLAGVLIAGLVFLAVSGALLAGLGAERLGESPTPLASLIDNGGSPALGVLVRIGAAVATGAALLAVLSRASATASVLSRIGDLPRWLGRTGSRGTPWVADLAGGAATVVVTLLVGPVTAMAVSVCAVLAYYALLHVAVLRLPRRSVRASVVAVAGVVICLVPASAVPPWALLVTAVLVAAGWIVGTWSARLRGKGSVPEVSDDGPGERAA